MKQSRTAILAAAFGLLALPVARADTCAGGWLRFNTPNPGSHGDNLAAAIAGRSPSDVWAVGAYDPDSQPTVLRNLALHYDGHAWSVVSTPNVGTQLNTLIALALTSDGGAWAAGYYIDEQSFFSRPLLLRYDAGTWTVPGYPSPGAAGNFFGLAATAPNDVWAVGDTQPGIGTLRTLIEHFDGSAWSVVPSPNPGNAGDVLYGVVASAANDAWAVGSQTVTGGPDQALILHWDGTAWRNVPPQRDGQANSNLYSVALTASGPEAVGEAENDVAGRDLAFAAAGASFRNVPVGASHTGDDRLQGMASGPDGEWAVGANTDWLGLGYPQTLVEYHAAGAPGWTIVPSGAINGGDDTQLGGVAVIGGEAWVAGWRPGAAGSHTLIAKTCH